MKFECEVWAPFRQKLTVSRMLRTAIFNLKSTLDIQFSLLEPLVFLAYSQWQKFYFLELWKGLDLLKIRISEGHLMYCNFYLFIYYSEQHTLLFGGGASSRGNQVFFGRKVSWICLGKGGISQINHLTLINQIENHY